MTVVAAIFARGGSRGIKDKNLADAAGTSLLARAVASARAAEEVDRVIVSTDSERIAEAALAAGAEVPFLRPVELAGDTSPEWLAWRHAVEFLRAESGPGPDLLVAVPTTSPLRLPEDIDAVVREQRAGGWDAVLAVTPAHRHPSFNMVVRDEVGQASIAMPAGTISRRQDAPAMFDITTVAYAVRPQAVLDLDSLFAGRVGTVVVPQERALDIDTPHDLEIARLLLAAHGR